MCHCNVYRFIAPSCIRRACFALVPPLLYSPRLPFARTTRWHGTSGRKLCFMIVPTARDAPGLPARAATSPYVIVDPLGMLRTTLSTRSVNEELFCICIWYYAEKETPLNFYFSHAMLNVKNVIIPCIAMAFVWAVQGQVVFARNSNLTQVVNSDPIPLATKYPLPGTPGGVEVYGDNVLRNLFIGWGIFMIVFSAISIFTTVFWIMMLIHVAKNDVENKTLWILLMVFTGVVGAVVYYFIVKRSYKE